MPVAKRDFPSATSEASLRWARFRDGGREKKPEASVCECVCECVCVCVCVCVCCVCARV